MFNKATESHNKHTSRYLPHINRVGTLTIFVGNLAAYPSASLMWIRVEIDPIAADCFRTKIGKPSININSTECETLYSAKEGDFKTIYSHKFTARMAHNVISFPAKYSIDLFIVDFLILTAKTDFCMKNWLSSILISFHVPVKYDGCGAKDKFNISSACS